jgi:hypothetical protein
MRSLRLKNPIQAAELMADSLAEASKALNRAEASLVAAAAHLSLCEEIARAEADSGPSGPVN